MPRGDAVYIAYRYYSRFRPAAGIDYTLPHHLLRSHLDLTQTGVCDTGIMG